MIEEVWKKVKYYDKKNNIIEFGGIYEVSNFGNIRSYRSRNGSKCPGRVSETPRMLKPHKSANGYFRVGLIGLDGKHKMYFVHRIVASTFIEIPKRLLEEDIIQVNHKNEDKSDNRIENLEWCTPLENTNYGSRTKRAIKNSVKTRTSKEWKDKNPDYKNPNAREVVGVNIKTGETIELENMNCADQYFDIKFAGRSVSATIRGRQKTAYGYRWYYKEDYNKQKCS